MYYRCYECFTGVMNVFAGAMNVFAGAMNVLQVL